MVLLIFVFRFIYEKVKNDNLVREEFLLHNKFGCTRATDQHRAKNSAEVVLIWVFCPH